ncbi:MAG: tryptophan--tRNA ligase, partial [Oscillospiraceae bacterium]|nr:tryptophan--tRNA ligase [Oscillospiraceae bacterium]
MSENISAPQKKKTILSGIQPTGVFTLGNYLGAVKNWAKLQDDYNCAYMIANMHAITVRQDATKLRAQTLDAFALLLACGVNPEKSLCF